MRIDRTRLERFSGFAVLFVLTFAFYLALAWDLGAHTIVTGTVSSLVVTAAFGSVTFGGGTRPIRVVERLVKSVVLGAVLSYEIAKANLVIAYLVLHPDLPIDPEVVEFEPTVTTPIGRLLLGLCITLTPGTVVIDTKRDTFVVHTLTPVPIDRLREGRIARAVEFVSTDGWQLRRGGDRG